MAFRAKIKDQLFKVYQFRRNKNSLKTSNLSLNLVGFNILIWTIRNNYFNALTFIFMPKILN